MKPSETMGETERQFMQNIPVKTITLWVLSLYIAFVFVQSLFFKFSDSPETQYIFGTLDAWADGFGLGGVFAPSGIFSQYVIGTAELIASVLLLSGLIMNRPAVHGFAALMALGVISGAIFFHLFTPLGVSVLNTDGTRDGGELFALACGVWIASAVIVWVRRDDLVRPVKLALPRSKS